MSPQPLHFFGLMYGSILSAFDFDLCFKNFCLLYVAVTPAASAQCPLDAAIAIGFPHPAIAAAVRAWVV